MIDKTNRRRRELVVRLVAAEKLIPYDGNARTHSAEQVAQVAASICEFGWTNPILVRPDHVIIAGHARLLAAQSLGMTEVPVIELDGLSETQCRALVIADNRLALNAGWDDEMLQTEIAALQQENFDVGLLGFEDEELAILLAAEEFAGREEDAVPDPPRVAVTRPGDLWLLGMHRLLCGDATILDDVHKLMRNDRADLVFTDPPYNVDYEGYSDDRLTIEGDRMSAEQFQTFLNDSFRCYRAVVKAESSLYVCHASSWQREFQTALEEAGFRIRCQIIWAKNTFAWGFGRYKFQHEPIFYGHVDGQRDAWYGDKSQSTLWEVDKPSANRLHPTMKPVELVERALENSSHRGDIVLDLFGGAGSTLLACERRRRKARLMELDPRYADVIVRRWEDYTGKNATLDSDGYTFEKVAGQRRASQSIAGATPRAEERDLVGETK